MFSRKTSAFSYCGEYFANCDVSGNIIIWETSSNTIKKVYDINSHIKQTCSTLTWGSFKSVVVGKKDSNEETQLLIIGTTTGDIYIYDFLDDKLFSHFESSHTDVVNDFSLALDSSCLFSCSSDKSVIVWNIISGKIKQKWKPFNEEIHSLCIIDDNSLLIGSTTISLWNIKKQEIIKTFCSCEAPVTLLTLIKSADCSSSSYFLSAASGIPKISAWCLNEENNQRAIATFLLPEELLNIDATSSFSKNDPMLLSAVTKSGSLVLFQHVLNGKTKNLSPVMTLHIISKANSNENKPCSIPIISSKLLYCAEACIISYGCDSNLAFESVNIFDCPKTLTLARDNPEPQKIKNISKVKLCKRLNDFTAVNGRASSLNSPHCSPGKKKRQEIHTEILNTSQNKTTDDTLNKMSMDDRIIPKSSNVKIKHKSSKIKKEKSNSSESDSELITPTDPSEMVDIILRGIQEDRPSLINSVLKCDNLELIKSTVRSLPLHSLNLILLELYRRLVLQENRYKSSYRRWLKEILSVHLPYLITCKDLTDTINRLKVFLDKRNVGGNLLKMNMLRGLIKIQIQNISQSKNDNSSSESDAEEVMES